MDNDKNSRPKSNIAQIILALCALVGLPFTIYSVVKADKIKESTDPESVEKLMGGNRDTYQVYDLENPVSVSDSSLKKSNEQQKLEYPSSSNLINDAVLEFLNRFSPGVEVSIFDRFITEKDFESALEVLRIAELNTENEGRLHSIDLRRRSIYLMKEKGFDQVWFSFPGNLILTELNDKQGLYSRNGNELYEPIFDNVDPVNFGPLYCVHLGDKYGFLDSNGNEIYPLVIDEIEPEKYYPLKLFGEGGKYGFITEDGEFLFKPTFDEVKRVWAESIIVRKGKKYGAIDLTGRFKLEMKFDLLRYDQNHNVFIAELHEQEMFFNDAGERVKNPIFDIEK
ncbi:WG repeat-containing protein [Lewinella cohaerens]|uniref:WG repeat-containing protein n=1 Tax=Lewinella cohaerens TaxID=70995 RepID=UPI000362340B|nr:WG repeat-containing protein [Lewinella cohaerens]